MCRARVRQSGFYTPCYTHRPSLSHILRNATPCKTRFMSGACTRIPADRPAAKLSLSRRTPSTPSQRGSWSKNPPVGRRSWRTRRPGRSRWRRRLRPWHGRPQSGRVCVCVCLRSGCGRSRAQQEVRRKEFDFCLGLMNMNATRSMKGLAARALSTAASRLTRHGLLLHLGVLPAPHPLISHNQPSTRML